MLFTFIDKGVYRPLGESGQTYEASVQIIGATTESSENFLTTFNRRIPMSITLPSLDARTLDERYAIISLFIQQEATRLGQQIDIEREAVLAFMLYDAEGNIGQVKRDLKLVCAKSFLYYRTHNLEHLVIRKRDLSLPVQKGLLKLKKYLSAWINLSTVKVIIYLSNQVPTKLFGRKIQLETCKFTMKSKKKSLICLKLT